MTERIHGVVIIEEEPPATCELCGAFEELRPYGPGGQRICYECAMKDRAGTERRMARILGATDDN